MIWRLFAFCGLLALAALACGGSEPAAPSTTGTAPTATTTALPPATTTSPAVDVPEGYELFDGSADGFLIALPSRWVALDVKEGDVEAIIAEADGLLEPEASELIRDSFASGTQFSLFAIDVTGDPNVNLITAPLGPLDSLENLEKLIPKQIEELLEATVPSVDRVEYGGTEGLRIIYEATFPAGPAEGHQYYMLTEDTAYIFTFTSFDPDADRATFAPVMETFTPIAG